MRIHLVEQRTPEWHALRAGKLTGSRAKDMLAKVKTGEAAGRRNLKYQLVAERLSGQPQESGYVNAAMEWGIEHEAEAIAAYEAVTGSLVEAVGFCEHDELLAGTSPDGFVDAAGCLSIKCPNTSTHCQYARSREEPAEHAAQNSHELWLTGRDWLDFVSYDPRLPKHLQLVIVRVHRALSEREAYEREVKTFLAEVQLEINALNTLTDLTGTLRAAVIV